MKHGLSVPGDALYKLFIINEAIFVLITYRYHLLQVFVAIILYLHHTRTSQQLFQLAKLNLTVVILVDHLEGRLQVLLLEHHRVLQATSDELSVIYLTILVRIDERQHFG